jgi:hypothetical protein
LKKRSLSEEQSHTQACLSESCLYIICLSQRLEDQVVEQVKDYVAEKKHTTLFPYRGSLAVD